MNISAEFTSRVKSTYSFVRLRYIPTGTTGDIQNNDTHLHGPFESNARKFFDQWHATNVTSYLASKKKKKEITEDAFIKNMSALSSVQVLRNKAVECCDYGIAALIEEDDEKMSLLKKSWRDNFREIYDEKFQKECLRELQERPVTAETTMLTYNYDQTL